MLRSFWQAAAALSIYTSIIVYCTHKSYHRLLDSVMERIKYNNQSSPPPTITPHLVWTLYSFTFISSHIHNFCCSYVVQLQVSEQIKVKFSSLKDTWSWHITADDCCEDQTWHPSWSAVLMGIWLLTIQCPRLNRQTPTVSGPKWLWRHSVFFYKYFVFLFHCFHFGAGFGWNLWSCQK